MVIKMEYQRNIEQKLHLFLKVFPIVLLVGARQTGKTTLVKSLSESKKYQYFSFDDVSVFSAAKKDPMGFLKSHQGPIIIDEVQRIPEIFLAMKQVVDTEKKLGQIILTGSANPLFLPKIEDSLAGRMGVLHMYPFSQGELLGKREKFIDWVYSEEFCLQSFRDFSLDKLGEMIFKGGFPRAQFFSSNLEIVTWIGAYLQAMLDRDVRDLAQIEGLHYFPDLLKLLANRSGSLLNGADIARTLKMKTISIHRYLALLEALFFIFRERAWFSNRSKRIAKSSKIYLCDTGILSYLLNANELLFRNNSTLFGSLLESFVVSELLKQASWMEEKIDQYHYRESTYEVDIILENRGGSIVGIEVKKSSTIKESDFSGIKRLKQVAGKKFVRGIILYTGSNMVSFGDGLWAVPVSSLWEV